MIRTQINKQNTSNKQSHGIVGSSTTKYYPFALSLLRSVYVYIDTPETYNRSLLQYPAEKIK